MSTKIDPSENPTVEHRVRDFLKALNSGGGAPIETLPPIDARLVLVNAQKAAGVPLPPCDVEDKTIEQDGLEVKLTIVRPKGTISVLPGFMFFHGGGWILGDYETHERFVRDLVVDSGCVAIFVNYPPSPEAKYPVAINQAFAATKWIAEHGAEINVDGKRLALAGNSVGGNMTAAVAIKAKENGGPELKCQILFWPVTAANFETESYNTYAEGYFLSKAMMKWFWDAYTTDPKQRAEIHASPAEECWREWRFDCYDGWNAPAPGAVPAPHLPSRSASSSTPPPEFRTPAGQSEDSGEAMAETGHRDSCARSRPGVWIPEKESHATQGSVRNTGQNTFPRVAIEFSAGMENRY